MSNGSTVHGAASHAAKAAADDPDIRTLRADVAKLRSDISKLGDTLQSIVQTRGADAVEYVQDRATEIGGRVRDEAKRRVQSVTDEIEERPVTATLIAFGTGLVLGMIFSGRR
jgi:ElaB/YqjD/DUF883 family membrane-anchored ribosome-binding protein